MARQKDYPEKLITAFLTEARPVDIQRTAKISNTKYYALKADPEFQRIITERRTEIVQSAVKQMEKSLEKNVGILQGIIENEKTAPQVRVNALALYHNQLSQWKMTTEILERIQRIESGII